MMRLPLFEYRAPRTVAEAADMLSGEGTNAMLLAGGTDLLPNMKRRQQTPHTLIGLRHVAGLGEIKWDGDVLRIGAGRQISELVNDARLPETCGALWQAASQIATPQIRNMATLGGNLCLDTRCNYYDQSYEWRKAIDFCMKKDGDICWVATSSPKCVAVSSTDTAPALMALGARVRLVSNAEEREITLSDFYNNDGINYLRRRPDEILAEIMVDLPGGWKSTYWKLRRRGAFDFPVLSVAAAVKLSTGGVVENARIVLGSVASRPLVTENAAGLLIGHKMTRENIAEAAASAGRMAKPLDNTDFDLTWRKRVTQELVSCALRELRGENMHSERQCLIGNPTR
jgi:4-hydroxybenzoyl-CoA reductase subunit beta